MSKDIRLDLERRAAEFGLELQDVSITAHTVIDDSALCNYRVPFKIALPTYFQTPNSRQLLP